MLQKACFTTKPEKILFENHEGGNRVWLRANIKKEKDKNKFFIQKINLN